MSSDRDMLTGLLADMLAWRSPPAPAQTRGDLDRNAVADLAAAGLLRVGVAEQWGGTGGRLLDAGEVVLRAGEYGVRAPVAEALVAAWSLAASQHAISDALLTFAFDEVVAEPAGDAAMATAIFRRVPYARHADSVVGFARTRTGLMLVSTPPHRPQTRWGVNLAGEPRDEIAFALDEGVATKVGEHVAVEARLRAQLFRALMISGAATRALAMTVTYATERVQFGRKISAFQAVQQQVARAAADVVAARTAADAALLLADEHGFGRSAEFAIVAAKLRCNQAAGAIASVAHQVHGAIGVAEEHPLHLATTRLWSWREECGRDLELAAGLTEMAATQGRLWSALAG
jgi:acyl-CoA dehydrogenase